jgi:hypothetical protein
MAHRAAVEMSTLHRGYVERILCDEQEEEERRSCLVSSFSTLSIATLD